MPTANNREPSTVQTRDSHLTSGGTETTVNAIELLKADHRQVEAWFEEFERTDDPARKQQLADDICKALEVHAEIEEEIFYPEFLRATADDELHHEAVVEHEGAKELIAKIRESGGAEGDDYFDARVKVLSEMIKHHVKEEEQEGGMFDEAAKSDMDLDALGGDLEQRKLELMEGADTDAGYDAAVASPEKDSDEDEDEEDDEDEDDDDDDDDDADVDEDDDDVDDDDSDDDDEDDEEEDDDESGKKGKGKTPAKGKTSTGGGKDSVDKGPGKGPVKSPGGGKPGGGKPSGGGRGKR